MFDTLATSENKVVEALDNDLFMQMLTADMNSTWKNNIDSMAQY